MQERGHNKCPRIVDVNVHPSKQAVDSTRSAPLVILLTQAALLFGPASCNEGLPEGIFDGFAIYI